MTIDDEKYAVMSNMIRYGGSFVKALGEALARADRNNTQKIKDTWPEYWEQYKGKQPAETAWPDFDGQ